MTGSGMRPLDPPCGEQGKLPTAEELMLAERDKHMSEQKASSFMQELDRWSESTIIGPLFGCDEEGDWEPVVERAKKAIRVKVLESYRNGLAAARKPVPAREFQR